MLINYIRTPRKTEAKIITHTDGSVIPVIVNKGGDPYGIIVSPERGKVGWAICSPSDNYNKEMGMRIALNRAEFYGTNREAVFSDAPDSIKIALAKMYDRSNRYYK